MDGPASPGCHLSLVLPAYHEADGIALAIREADAALDRLGCSYEIVVVDDGSRDATEAAVEQVIRELDGAGRIRLLSHAANRGYGAALRTGFEAARGQRIAFTDADRQFFPDDLAPLLRLTDDVPIAVGYRVDRQDSWLRCFCSRAYNLLAGTLLGTPVRDIDCALKVFRRDALARILPEATGFFVNTEMLTAARQLGLEIRETGVRHRPRRDGASKVSLFDIPRTLQSLLPFWWSRVLFAGQPRVPPKANAPRLALIAWLMILAMAALLFLGRLCSPLLEPEEARYAEIPRQMLAEGRFVTPVWHGEAYWHKPPLLYWLVMGSYQLFGVHDWAARLVPALASMLTVLATMAWARCAAGPRAALASGLVLVLSPLFIYLGGMLNCDSLLSLWIVLGLATAYQALARRIDFQSVRPALDRLEIYPTLRWGWWLASAAACGLGCLTKGPVALVLILTGVALWQGLEARAARVTLKGWLIYLAVTLGVAAPWFAAVALSDPHGLYDFIWLHNLARFLTPLDHEEPVWFFLPRLAVGLLPWSLLVPALVVFLARRGMRAARRRPPALGFFLLAFATCLGFFSLSACKRHAYITPALPLLALVLGTFLAQTLPRRLWHITPAACPVASGLVRSMRRLTLATLVVGLGFLGVAAACDLLVWTAALPLAAALAGLGWTWRAQSFRTTARLGATTLFGLLVIGVLAVLPDYHRRFGLGPGSRDVVGGSSTPVASYPRRWDSVSFYLQRDDVTVYSPDQQRRLLDDLRARGRTLLFVKRHRVLPDLLKALPPDLEFVPRGPTDSHVVGGLVRRREP